MRIKKGEIITDRDDEKENNKVFTNLSLLLVLFSNASSLLLLSQQCNNGEAV